jgi:cold shock CspA family protein
LYWHRGDVEAEQIKEQDPDYVDPETGRFKPKEEEESLQHTQMHPVGSGVDFHFRVEFENLSDEELGALCWALHPQGDPDKEYCHQLGMGKPFGMGAVELNATLHIEDRQQRYRSLFDDGRWTSVQTQASSERFEELVTRFEEDVLWKLDSKGVQFADDDKRLRDLGRIGMLLKMMEWREQAPDGTEYMDIENDDFDDRPVLQAPSAFGDLTGELGLRDKRPTQVSGPTADDFAGEGTVKWFDLEGPGYGFIDDDADIGEDVFLYKTERPQGSPPQEGDRLAYRVLETKDGFQAEGAKYI